MRNVFARVAAFFKSVKHGGPGKRVDWVAALNVKPADCACVEVISIFFEAINLNQAFSNGFIFPEIMKIFHSLFQSLTAAEYQLGKFQRLFPDGGDVKHVHPHQNVLYGVGNVINLL